MSWRRILLFVAVAYLLAALGGAVYALLGGVRGNAFGVVLGMMYAPTVAAGVVRLVTGAPLPALGLVSRPNRWWALAVLAPVVLLVATAAFTVWFVPEARWLPDHEAASLEPSRYRGPEATEEMRGMLRSALWTRLAVMFAGSWALGIVLALAALGEEIGWRGFLHAELAPLGSVGRAVVGGTIWALWHLPLIAQGYGRLGDEPWPAIAAGYVVYCVGLAGLLGVLRDRGRSVWPAALAHGVMNALLPLSRKLVGGDPPAFDGLTGMVGLCLVLAVGLAAAWAHGRARIPTDDGNPGVAARSIGT